MEQNNNNVDKNLLFEQYKVYCQMKEGFVDRNFMTNKFYLCVVICIFNSEDHGSIHFTTGWPCIMRWIWRRQSPWFGHTTLFFEQIPIHLMINIRQGYRITSYW